MARKKTLAASEGTAPVISAKNTPRPKPEGYVFGRPTDYRPEYCEMVIEWGKLGKSKTWMAASLDVTKKTFYEWESKHPDFLNATTRAMAHSQKWWEDAGQNGMEKNVFNSTVWTKNMAARFRDEWTDRQETAITGAEGGAIRHDIAFVIVDPSPT